MQHLFFLELDRLMNEKYYMLYNQISQNVKINKVYT